MAPQIETARLILRPLEIGDADAIQRIFPRWEIVQYLAAVVPWPYPPDGAIRYIRDEALPVTAEGREWHWTIRLKTSPSELIGLIGLRREPGHHRGFWLVPEYQRQGLMTEACEAVNAFWFDVLGEPVLQVTKAVGNAGSRRISEKEGMRIIATYEGDYVSGRQPAETWEITAEEWRRRQR